MCNMMCKAYTDAGKTGFVTGDLVGYVNSGNEVVWAEVLQVHRDKLVLDDGAERKPELCWHMPEYLDDLKAPDPNYV